MLFQKKAFPVQKHLQVVDAVLYLQGLDEFPNRLCLSQHEAWWNIVLSSSTAAAPSSPVDTRLNLRSVAVDDVYVLDQLSGGVHVAQLHGED